MAGYVEDMIIADLDGMDTFLGVANNIKDELFLQIRQMDKKYRAIQNWDDDVVRRTCEVLSAIEKQADILAENIENLNRNFGLLIDDLKDYNNPNIGKMGRL